VIYDGPLSYGETINKQLILYPGNYQLKLTVYGNADLQASVSYHTGSPENQLMNVAVGGVRVAKVTTTDPVTGLSSVKKYRYNLFEDESKSSCAYAEVPNYEKETYDYFPCGTSIYEGYGKSVYNTLFASALSSIYYNGNPVSYQNVTESFGENSENGLVQHEFTAVSDARGAILFGEYLEGSPNIDNHLLNGQETYTGTFKKTDNSFVPVKKVFTHFQDDSRIDQVINGYAAVRNYEFRGQSDGVHSEDWLLAHYITTAFDVTSYNIYRKWIYVDEVKTQVYDPLGTQFIETVQTSQYGNPNHALVTKIEDHNSTGKTLSTTYAYPTDFSSTAPYNTMETLNIVSPIIQETETVDGTMTMVKRNVFKNWSGTVFAKETISSQTSSQPKEDIRIRYLRYDDFANPLELQQTDGPSTTYLWGYNSQYPVAEVKNATYAQVLAVLGQGTINQLADSSPGDDATVRNLLAPLRAALPGSLVTTYTYKPLVGMTSATDPKGETMYYEYDSFQRLKTVKDSQGNIIKQYDYHYQNQ
jgi:YD repeat-containing protein